VLPTWLAVRVNRNRIVQAQRDAATIAETIEHGSLLHLRSESATVLVGPGQAPKFQTEAEWLSGRVESLASELFQDRASVGPDPWQNRYMVNAGAAQSRASDDGPHAVFVLSAGPNGIIETPFWQPAQTAKGRGDDILVRIR
jgi:hypothetical protein